MSTTSAKNLRTSHKKIPKGLRSWNFSIQIVSSSNWKRKLSLCLLTYTTNTYNILESILQLLKWPSSPMPVFSSPWNGRKYILLFSVIGVRSLNRLSSMKQEFSKLWTSSLISQALNNTLSFTWTKIMKAKNKLFFFSLSLSCISSLGRYTKTILLKLFKRLLTRSDRQFSWKIRLNMLKLIKISRLSSSKTRISGKTSSGRMKCMSRIHSNDLFFYYHLLNHLVILRLFLS